jgi:hypothetical protein
MSRDVSDEATQIMLAAKIENALPSWVGDSREEGDDLRRRYKDRADSLTDLRALYETAVEEVQAENEQIRTEALTQPEKPIAETVSVETFQRLEKWQQRRDVLRSMLLEEHEPQLPPEKYERRLRAALSAYKEGMTFTELAAEAANDREVDVGKDSILKDLRGAFQNRHGLKDQVNANVLPDLLEREANHWGIGWRKMEKVE